MEEHPIVRELRESLFQGENAAKQEASQIHEELSNLNPNIEIDAKEFGEHVRNGGWRLGLLVARSVEPGAGHGGDRRSDQRSELIVDPVGKVSAKSFARQSGNISFNTVLKYLNAWDLAAADDLVPEASDLVPGQSYSFDPDTHKPEIWKSKYFKTKGEEKETNFCVKLERSVNSLHNLEIGDINEALFNADQFDYNPESLFDIAGNGIRKLQEIQKQLETVAIKLGYQIKHGEDE